MSAPATPKPTPTPTQRPSADSASSTKVATASLSDGKNEPVFFMFAPNSIKIGHGSESKAMNRALGMSKPSGDGQAMLVMPTNGDAITDPGDTTITFGEILFDGPNVQKYCARLLQWTYPENLAETAQCAAEVPVLKFRWSEFSLPWPLANLELVLQKVDIEFNRFTDQGRPVRATATLSCKMKVSREPVKGQNPTSGGLPDRSGFRVTEGQSIQGIARQRYGDPDRWRDVAEVNGIDDPLRIRPGDLLYLPSWSELGRAVAE